MTPATVNRDLAILKHLMNTAIAWGYLYENPAKPVKLLRENNARLRYLTKDEIDRLIDAAHTQLRPIITLAVNTGMRRGEIFDLQWGEIDLKNRVIDVLDTRMEANVLSQLTGHYWKLSTVCRGGSILPMCFPEKMVRDSPILRQAS